MRLLSALAFPGRAGGMLAELAPTPPEPASVASLVRLALGRLEGEDLDACARSLLFSPTTRERLRGIRAEIGGGEGTGLVRRTVEDGLDAARGADRTLAEGRWQEGTAAVHDALPTLVAAWWAAPAVGQPEAVGTIARALLSVLMDMGERWAFGSLTEAALATADRTGDARLRVYVLGFRGAEAAHRGDTVTAAAFWRERVALARRTRHHAAEADALMDLSGLPRDAGDLEGCRRLLDEAAAPVAAAGRADLAATLLSNRALLALEEGCLEDAAVLARHAAGTLDGAQGALVGLFVRMAAARTLSASGHGSESMEATLDVVERCVEAGRSVGAAYALWDLADLLAREGLPKLAPRALAVSVAGLRLLGARRLPEAQARLAVAEASQGPAAEVAPDRWSVEAARLVAEIREFRGIAVAAT